MLVWHSPKNDVPTLIAYGDREIIMDEHKDNEKRTLNYKAINVWAFVVVASWMAIVLLLLVIRKWLNP
jgi:hypothetical protein